MDLPEIQMLWVRGRLSTLERLSIVSHLKNGHPVRLFSYEPIPNLPDGTIREDARAILPESAIFTHPAAVGYGALSTFSDFFRYSLLLQRGGIWSDCDSVCVKPLTFTADSEYVFGSERLPELQDGKPAVRVIAGVFKAPSGSAVVARALEIAQNVDLPSAPWASAGPGALNQAVNDLGLNQFIFHPDVFCPINWWEVSALVSGMAMLPGNTYAVHFWNEMWRRNFLDKDASYDPLSLYERLKRHYLDD